MIVFAPVLIRLGDKLFHLLLCHAVPQHGLLHTEIMGRMDENTHNIGVVPQNIVRAPSYDHAGFCFCQLFNNLCLIINRFRVDTKSSESGGSSSP